MTGPRIVYSSVTGRPACLHLTDGAPIAIDGGIMLGWAGRRGAITLDLAGASPEYLADLTTALLDLRAQPPSGRHAREAS